MTKQYVIAAPDWFVGIMSAHRTDYYPLVGWLVFQDHDADDPVMGGMWVDARGNITRFTEHVGKPVTLSYWHVSQMTDEMMESAFSRGDTRTDQDD